MIRMGEKFVNLPNALTISRFILIPVYIGVFAMGYHKLAFLVIVVAGCTDALDGYLARKNDQVTEVGSMLDPLADKTMMIAVILTLLVAQLIPWQAAVLIFIRDFGMIVGSAIFHYRGKKTVPANWMGKFTTAFYYVTLMFIFFKWQYAELLLWTVIIFSFLTSLIYIFLFRVLNRSQQST